MPKPKVTAAQKREKLLNFFYTTKQVGADCCRYVFFCVRIGRSNVGAEKMGTPLSCGGLQS